MSDSNETLWVDPDYTYYSFYGMKEFVLFIQANGEGLMPPTEGLEVDTANAIKDVATKADMFVKTHANTKGGCGCNKKQRIERAEGQYANFLNTLNSCEPALNHVKSLLNSVEKIHFWKEGQRWTSASGAMEMPFMIL